MPYLPTETTRVRLFPLIAAVLTIVFALSPSPVRAEEPARPRLVVLVFFDQFRGDYLDRWKGEFGEGGFARLSADGAWFTNCHYPYALTVTGAGHASVSTGCGPADHGIIT